MSFRKNANKILAVTVQTIHWSRFLICFENIVWKIQKQQHSMQGKRDRIQLILGLMLLNLLFKTADSSRPVFTKGSKKAFLYFCIWNTVFTIWDFNHWYLPRPENQRTYVLLNAFVVLHKNWVYDPLSCVFTHSRKKISQLERKTPLSLCFHLHKRAARASVQFLSN